MKTSAIAFLGLALMASAAQAQCGCGVPSYVPVMPVRAMPVAPAYLPPATYSAPIPTYSAQMPSSGPASVAYVNKLTNPIPRPNYTLNYAIHLTDGRVLLSDFLPSGYQVQGTEYSSGGQRKLDVSLAGDNSVTVRDPQSNATVTTFTR